MQQKFHSKLKPIAVATALLALQTAVQAQQTEKSQEVVVTGIRASLQQSMNQKRNAETLVEVITAEDVGKMPDKNVADSLQRIPGVSVAAAGGGEGSFGENDRVALRGTPFGLTLTTLGGHSVSSGDWFADNIVGGGRSVSFSLFPSELIGRVTVHKGAQASLLEGGATGVVDIETRKPLDFKKNFTAQASVGIVNSANSGKTDPQLSGLVAWKNDDSTLGVLVQAYHQKRTLSRAGQENQIWWDKVEPGSAIDKAISGSSTANKATATPSGAVTSYLGGTAWFEQQRTRDGGLIDLQIKPNKDFSLDVSAFYSHLDAPNINHNYMQSLGRFLGPSWGNPDFPSSSLTGTLSNGVISQLNAGNPANCTTCNSMSSAVQEIFSRPVAESKSQFFNIDGNYRVNDKLTVSGKLGTTEGLGNTVSGAMGIWMPWTGGGYTIRGVDDAVIYNIPGADKFSIGGFNNGNPGKPGAPYTYGSHVTANDKETYAQLDAKLKVELGSVHTLKFGVRAAEHKRDLTSIGINALPGLASAANLPMSGLTAFPNIFNDLGANGAGYWTFSQAAVNSWLAQYTNYSGHLLQNEFSIKEPTQSAYLQADFGDDGFSGNFGVRAVRTKVDVTRNEIGKSGNFEPRLYSNSYNDFLPSLNLRYDLNKDMVTRFALSRTMARPELGQMAGLDLRDVQGTGNGGNPNLNPIRSNNLDLGIEWYFAPKSMVSAGLFYSKIDGYVTYGASKGTFYNQIQGKNTEYQMSTPINTTAEVKGLELSYTQALAGGFGINANYTYTDGKETGKAPGSKCGDTLAPDCTLIGTSKHAYNLGAFYENDKFSARVTYSFRSGFLNGTSRNSAAFQNDIGTLSASLAYNISDSLTLTLDGKDLNNPLVSSRTKIPGAADLPASLYKNGRQIFLTLHAKM